MRQGISIAGSQAQHSVACRSSHPNLQRPFSSKLPVSASRPLPTASATPEIASDTPKGVAWDPEGLLPPPPAGGHFARRERAQQTIRAPPAGTPTLKPLPAGSPAEGIPGCDGSLFDKKAYAALLSDKYMPVDLDYPGLKILHFDPPVIIIEDFFTPEECTAMIDAALNTGKMARSKVGAGNATTNTATAIKLDRRTSSSIVVDAALLRDHKGLEPSALLLQARGQALLSSKSSSRSNKPWGAPGKLPLPGQYCYESLQVAKYENGQYFLEHEDAFPAPLAVTNQFQRHATLLVYLNDVAAGGATKFEYLNLDVRPKCGRALLFFPATSDGFADARTLHTAETAEDIKWVTQQWIARGFKEGTNDTKSNGDNTKSMEEVLRRGKAKKKEKKKSGSGGGGFGFK